MKSPSEIWIERLESENARLRERLLKYENSDGTRKKMASEEDMKFWMRRIGISG